MAKATALCKCRFCGNDFKVEAFKINRKEANSWKEWAEDNIDICQKCDREIYEAEREKENKKAMEKSIAMGLPELTGSEKQVAWANSLRLDFVCQYEKELTKMNDIIQNADKEKQPEMIAQKKSFCDAMDYAVNTKTDARYWIDSRDKRSNFLMWELLSEYKEMKKNEIPPEVAQEIKQEKMQLTVTPEIPEKSGVIVMYFKKPYIMVKYIKDDVFLKIVKDLDYSWDYDNLSWKKEITEYNGTADDRMAELGNQLLLAGFTVEFSTESSKKMALSGDFKPECKRWIKFIRGRLFIQWYGWNDALYGAAKKLPGARWDKGGMAVPVEFYKEVQDFAETMEFKFSKRSQKEINNYIQKENGYEKAIATVPEQETTTDEEKIRKSLKSNGAIIEDLLDV